MAGERLFMLEKLAQNSKFWTVTSKATFSRENEGRYPSWKDHI